MTTSEVKPQEIQRAKLNFETGQIAWHDLQRFFAAGKVLIVAPELDLVTVGIEVEADNKEQVGLWVQQKLLLPVDDDSATRWFESNEMLWAVVVSPWVLVQDRPAASQPTEPSNLPSD